MTKRRVNSWDRAGNILQDATCGKALKAELEVYWSLQVGRTRIVYRLTTGTIEIVTIGSRQSVYEEALREIRRGKEKGEFFYTRQGGKKQGGKDERYKPKIRKSNSRKKAALTLDIDGRL